MSSSFRVAVISDIHYASAAEQVRGEDYETRDLPGPVVRRLLRAYRDWIWLRHPFGQNHLLDRFLADAGEPDLVVGNGDYTCDSGFIGVADAAAFASVAECLGKLRKRFGNRLVATLGDHELGKKTLLGNAGHLTLDSYELATRELGIAPYWERELGRWKLIGVSSSLVALPHFEADARPADLPRWRALREEHLAAVRRGFAAVASEQRVVLFCHDPTALPFLARETGLRERLPQIEQTIIGHLHTPLVFWKSRLLGGMPELKFLGHTVRKLSRALNEARAWKPFQVRLCPSPAGCELLKDGGWLALELPETGPARVTMHPLPR